MKTSPVQSNSPAIRAIIFIAALLFVSGSLSAQYLTGINPDEGMQGETLDLIISGQNTHFMQATSVSVNLQQGTATIIMPQQIGFMSNEILEATFSFSYSDDPGLYDLRVMNDIDGSMYLFDGFEITWNPVQPELVSVDPDTATQGEELDVVISGQNTHFQASTTTVALKQGSVTILPQYRQILSDTEISAHFAFGIYHPTGIYNVQTNNYIDGQLTLPDAFTLLPGEAPSLVGIEPASAMNGTLYNFDVFGENTHFLDASGHMAWLMHNGVNVIGLEYEVMSNVHLQGTIVLPHVSPAGSWDLHVMNNLDGEIILEDAFILNENPEDPEVLYLEPDSAYQGNTVEVDAFTQSTWFSWVQSLNAYLKQTGTPNYIPNQGIQIVHDEQLEMDFYFPPDAAPGYYDLYITDNIDGQIIGINQFYVIDTITGLSEPKKPNLITVYPNPAFNNLYISSDETIQNCNLTINNFMGQQIRISDLTIYKGVPIRINIADLSKGLYLVNLISKDKMIIKKAIKY